MKRLQTFMSPVMARCPSESAADVSAGDNGDDRRPPERDLASSESTGNPSARDETAGDESAPDNAVVLHHVNIGNRKLYWLDEMLYGGLLIPDDLWESYEGSPSFSLLIAGPPGTGKTTFALELCYNLASKAQKDGSTFCSLFVSSETPSQRIIENALSFGWDGKFFRRHSKATFEDRDDPIQLDCCNVVGSEYPLCPSGIGKLAPDAERLFAAIANLMQRRVPRENSEGIVGAFTAEATRESLPPDVVVLDSLNVVGPARAGEQAQSSGLLDIFFRLRNAIGGGDTAKRPKLLILVLDSFDDDAQNNPWEFVADAAFRFDGQIGPENYFVRSFQIVKIRTQSHALGKNHAFKILAGASDEQNREPSGRLFGTPYQEAGGSFIFPSIHWHLSRSLRESPVRFSRVERYPTGLPKLDTILKDGFPSMHTTALVGHRGAMKSHLAYNFMLSHAFGTASNNEKPKNVLLVSLRDDLESAKETLTQIIREQNIAGMGSDASRALQSLLSCDRVEIIYNWPGCITPNEFFHRIYVALARERLNRPLCGVFGSPKTNDRAQSTTDAIEAIPDRNTAEVVVFNGLDHLDVKFPLCADEKLFVPALVSLFRGFKTCSVFISADDRHGSTNDIRPLADLILEFGVPDETDYRAVREVQAIQASKVSAIRVPAGQIGGLWGILRRDLSGKMRFATATPAGDVEPDNGGGI